MILLRNIDNIVEYLNTFDKYPLHSMYIRMDAAARNELVLCVLYDEAGNFHFLTNSPSTTEQEVTLLCTNNIQGNLSILRAIQGSLPSTFDELDSMYEHGLFQLLTDLKHYSQLMNFKDITLQNLDNQIQDINEALAERNKSELDQAAFNLLEQAQKEFFRETHSDPYKIDIDNDGAVDAVDVRPQMNEIATVADIDKITKELQR